MPSSPAYVIKSKWCALAATAITILALMPQIHFWFVRGSQWHGAYVVLQPDELLYSAYVGALIDGRPRRNDPFSGRDDHPEAPLPESLFFFHSIVPVYVVSTLARPFGASASSAFIMLIGLAGLLVSLSVFWLLASVLGDSRFAAIGVVVVLCFGALAGGQGLIGLLLNPEVKFLGLPFLRRYEPSAPFPLVFVFCALVWQALTSAVRRTATITALMAGVTLGLLVFSYFHLWTAAFAWFVCVACLWLIMRPLDKRKALKIILIVSLPILMALGFFSYLLLLLPSTLNKPSVLTLTHRPDLLRVPEVVGAFVLVALIMAVRRNKVPHNEPRVIFAASFALLPFLVFNQQIITGRSIQPFHYEILIANYIVLLGLVITAQLWVLAITHRAKLLVVASCLLWGAIEVNLALQARYSSNVSYDEMVPVLLRLREQAEHDGTWEGLRNHGKAPALVFSPEYRFSVLLPTWAPQGALLATGQGLSEAAPKEQLYAHLYYCGRNRDYLRELLNDRTGDPYGTYYAKTTIFGPERGVAFLNQDVQPIVQDEIEKEVSAYESFSDSFSRNDVLKLPLGYAVTPSDVEFDFSHIDLWYERDAGVSVGAYTLYRLKLRE
jgi:MFS family permease